MEISVEDLVFDIAEGFAASVVALWRCITSADTEGNLAPATALPVATALTAGVATEQRSLTMATELTATTAMTYSPIQISHIYNLLDSASCC